MCDSDTAGERVDLVADDNQMDVVRHEAISPDANSLALATFMAQREIAAPVVIVEKDRLSAIASMCDVIRATWVDDSSNTRHDLARERRERPCRV
jgi:hypothetical protein